MHNIEDIKKEGLPPGISGFIAEGVMLTGHVLRAPRMSSSVPCMYRQVRYGDDPTVVLQGGYQWQEGWSDSGIDWRDMPIEQLPAREQEEKQ